MRLSGDVGPRSNATDNYLSVLHCLWSHVFSRNRYKVDDGQSWCCSRLGDHQRNRCRNPICRRARPYRTDGFRRTLFGFFARWWRRFNGSSNRRGAGDNYCFGGAAASDDKVKRVQTMDAQTRRWLIAMSVAIALLILAMAL